MKIEGSLPHQKTALHLSLTWAISVSSKAPLEFLKIQFNIILIRLGLPSGLFHSGFLTKTQYAQPFSPYVLHAPPLSYFLIWFLIIFAKGRRSWKSPLYCIISSRTCYLIPLWAKYHCQQPQPMFFPRSARPSFTPIQNNGQNCSSVYLIFKFLNGKLDDRRFWTKR